MLKKRLTLAILALLIIFSACAFTIKTWQVDVDNVPKECQNVEPLVRLKGDHVQEALTIAKANGYRCYSEQDDTEWRTELKVQTDCCNGRSSR